MQRASVWIVVAGLASGISGVAAGQTTLLTFETSADAGQNWSSDVQVAPGTTVYVRLRAQLNGATATGLAGLTFQPRVSNWHPGSDQKVAFTFPGLDNAGTPVSETAYNGRHVAATPAANTGRIFPFGSAGQGASSPSGVIMGHENAGSTLWYAGANATLPGVQPHYGIGISQFPSSISGSNYNASLNVEVFRFAVRVNSTEAVRQIDLANLSNNTVYWYTDTDGVSPLVSNNVLVNVGRITMVPAPGALGVLGVAGVVALRRRRK